jgi:hypothetical protein
MLRRLWIAAVLVAANACVASTLRVDQTLSPTFTDLATIKSLEVTTQQGDVLARGTFAEGTTSSGKLERTASLTSPEDNTARGTAEIDIDRTGGLSDEEIVVKLEKLPYPESCRLMADGHELTIFSTTAKDKLEFRLTRRVAFANGRTPPQ